MLAAVAKQVGDDAHGVPGWVNVRAACNVLFQDIVLHGTRKLAKLHSLFFCHRDIQCEQDTGRGIDGHGCADALERQAMQQRLHIFQAGDGDADFAYLAR